MAIPTGLTGVLLIILLTGATLNVMSLMGLIMMVGIVVSNSILIVEFTNRLRAEGRPVRERVSLACRTRLRPVLITSLATVFGLLPMALALEAGSETYAPLALSIIGGPVVPGAANPLRQVHQPVQPFLQCLVRRGRRRQNIQGRQCPMPSGVAVNPCFE